ncbi:Uncharacterised protein [Mycobacteroides abscessus subsp. abscessus]|nr:Uncharacterised protein [Mycobacteroides abscessus subsp. abscessus]
MHAILEPDLVVERDGRASLQPPEQRTERGNLHIRVNESRPIELLPITEHEVLEISL